MSVSLQKGQKISLSKEGASRTCGLLCELRALLNEARSALF